MLYTEKEKHEIERVKEVFAEHLRQSPDFELLWSDKVGYVWLAIGVNPVYVDTGIRIESAADLCGKCLDDVASVATSSKHLPQRSAADSILIPVST